MAKKTKEKIKDEAIRIPITKELLANFFLTGERHFNVVKGITKHHKLVGVLQSSTNARYYLLFVSGKPPEGITFADFMPVVETIPLPRTKKEIKRWRF